MMCAGMRYLNVGQNESPFGHSGVWANVGEDLFADGVRLSEESPGFR